jgi:hypothetical protein
VLRKVHILHTSYDVEWQAVLKHGLNIVMIFYKCNICIISTIFEREVIMSRFGIKTRNEILEFIRSHDDVHRALCLVKKSHPDSLLWALPRLNDDKYVVVVCKYPNVTFEDLWDIVKPIFPSMAYDSDEFPSLPLVLLEGPDALTIQNMIDITEDIDNG